MRGVTLHIDNLRGVNSHHQAETVFKAFGRALRMARDAGCAHGRRHAVHQGHALAP
jgi:imidazoleglycerol-phosphate dehydratase